MNNLKNIRSKRGLSQNDLANVIEISLPNYCKKENEMIKFSLCEAKKLSDYLGLSIEDIFFTNEVSIFDT